MGAVSERERDACLVERKLTQGKRRGEKKRWQGKWGTVPIEEGKGEGKEWYWYSLSLVSESQSNKKRTPSSP